MRSRKTCSRSWTRYWKQGSWGLLEAASHLGVIFFWRLLVMFSFPHLKQETKSNKILVLVTLLSSANTLRPNLNYLFLNGTNHITNTIRLNLNSLFWNGTWLFWNGTHHIMLLWLPVAVELLFCYCIFGGWALSSFKMVAFPKAI